MSAQTVRRLLTCWGAAAAIAAGVELARADALDSVGPHWALAFLATWVVGVWITRAEPDNPAARRLLLFGCAALTFLAASCELILQVRNATDGAWFVAANAAVQAVGLLMVAAQVAAIVRYPNGTPLLVAERVLGSAVVALAVVLPPALLLTRSEVTPAWVLQWSERSDGLSVPTVAGPAYVDALAWLGPPLEALHNGVLAVAPLLAIGILAARWRLLEQREQARVAWPLLAGVLFLIGLGISLLADAGAIPRVLGEGVYLLMHVVLPVAMGIGIAAPGLYDPLGTVRRTLAFVAMSAVVLGLYVGTAGYLGMTVGGRDLRTAVMVALLAALVLEPARRFLVRRAGRVAYGTEISRDELLLRLGDALEHTLDRRALAESIALTALEGLEVQWLRLEADGAGVVHVGRPLRVGEQPALASRLRNGHEDLGTISCGPSSVGLAHTRSRMQLDALARQVAMALTNARLADELNIRLSELAASRQRLVTAEETARRRLERDLHDGAQQDLAALLTRIALARSQLGRSDLDRVEQTLTTLQADAEEALRNLRELVSGLDESVLADQGLAAAIEGRAAKLPIPVQVRIGPGVRDTRLAAPVESTAYFTVCEALANTLKHSHAGHAVVALSQQDGQLHINVADDGHGFDPAQVNGTTSLTGLRGLRDRVSAVGGTLNIRSAPGRGTTLTAVVPTQP
jgi:signal transduction histidine kinase